MSKSQEPPADGLPRAHAVRLGLLAGLASHLPWLALSRLDALKPLAVATLAAFWCFDPWLTIPLFRRVRSAPAARGTDLRFGLISGAIAGSVAGLTTLLWERARTSAWLSPADSAAHLVYPAAATLFAVLAVLAARRRGSERGSEP